ncbi:MAG TPA: molybdenum cofactor guanylyltransferase MobA [Burkholderiales bacterium]|nr:molybdenum cofactor guanylyltransferase MobA [Burkholderiales bacterium]
MSATPSSNRPPITAVVLAGGLGRRMGRVDKGLQLLDGRPLAAWVLDRLAPQVDEILVSANANRGAYEAFGHRVIEDRIAGHAGPLAGLHSALCEARYALVACAPCDTPFLPTEFVARLHDPLSDDRVDLSVARTGMRTHPVVCLARRRLLPHLDAFLGNGGRKFEEWYASLRVAQVAFDDEADAFRNINSPAELRAAQRTKPL